MPSIFRTKAINSQKPKFEGEILFDSPSTKLAFNTVLLVFCLLLTLSLFLDFTVKVIAEGEVTYNVPLVHIYRPEKGYISKYKIQEGTRVSEKDVLFTIDQQREIITGSNQLISPISYIEKEIEISHNTLEVIESKLKTLKRRTTSLREERKNKLSDLKFELDQERKSLDIDIRRLASYKGESGMSVVTSIERERLYKNSLKSKVRISNIENEIKTTMLDITERELNTEIQIIDSKKQKNDLEKEIVSLERDLLLQKRNYSYEVLSPLSGEVILVHARNSSYQPEREPVITIAPDKAELVCVLQVPADNAHQVSKGMDVSIKFHGISHQKYGVLNGKVAEISKGSIRTSSKDGGKLSMYSVLVHLPNNEQTSQYRGKMLEGMKLSGVITVENNKVFAFLQNFLSI
ncbi:HlyD family efflux transporter periplasmic adaptor subunit [uncultured Pseudoteredinibacter sp.]|uniref:HlyD family secretion protein n=1 Tax=uncultured Pseudoteredinibacter sp. TaxID=1641701 RepID=UPI0026339E85|nr:HlyD family efflux transporter periplasmic adaptor subunit [uncultured Pseudoteredinibacter sp.]